MHLHKDNQRLKDLRRIDSKLLREDIRTSNVLEELNKSFIKLLENNNLKSFTKQHKAPNDKVLSYGVINLTDLHFNELISAESISNKYDFDIAGKRLKKLANHAKKIFNSYGIKDILLACTGDFLNSDRRQEEKMSMATNRTQATLLSCYLLEQFIIDLNDSFNIKIASVIGNESRVNDDYAYAEIIASDNYDMMIESILRIMFKNCKGVSFVDGGKIEKVVSLGGVNILLLHGDKLSHSSIDRAIYSKMAKYAHKGIIIDYVLFGHLHEAMVSDYFARGSSLAGGNSYSDEGLNLISKASQNIFIIEPKAKDIHGIKVCLQNIKDIIGYDINKNLEAYNAKSVSKLHDSKTILQIVL
jgi:predicted phosphodiesterase